MARVTAGILLARALGFIRERVIAQFFGIGIEADAWGAAMKIPNVIRNLLGEGTLSASFIPVYAGMIERGETENASKLAGAVASTLVLLTGSCALIGYLLAPVVTDIAAPGFSGYQRDLTIALVRILFPMFGFLILSAWCLGILNTHRRFFLSYAAPSVWNIAQIATLVALGGSIAGAPLVVALAWGAVAGSILQIAIQLPVVLPLVGGVRLSLNIDTPGFRRVVKNWVPVVFGAGVVQVSSLIDTQLASLLPTGSVGALRWAQLFAILPISLFGVGVAAVALPELSREAVGSGVEALRHRMSVGLRQLVYFVVPSAFAFAALGPELVGALLQTGSFDRAGALFVGGVLSAYALAVPAQTSIKLLASGHYALGDTKTPVRIGIVSVVVSAVSAYFIMQYLGAAGIALGAALGAYLNVILNSRALVRKIGAILPKEEFRWLWVASLAAVVAALASDYLTGFLEGQHIWIEAGAGIFSFVLIYGFGSLLLKHPEARRLANALLRRDR